MMTSENTIYIVDDDVAVRDSLKLLLESHDCHVQDYGSTREFFAAYQPQEKQCLVLDQHLPGETGLDFLESSEGSTLQVPVIVMSGGGDSALQKRAQKAGVVAYFDKPLDNAVLLATIFKALGISSEA
jgi:FixJ family two-component response regulator